MTINSHTYRSTVAVYGDKFFLPLSAENRTAAGVAAGDNVDVALELDTAPREVSVPPDGSAASTKRSPSCVLVRLSADAARQLHRGSEIERTEVEKRARCALEIVAVRSQIQCHPGKAVGENDEHISALTRFPVLKGMRFLTAGGQRAHDAPAILQNMRA